MRRAALQAFRSARRPVLRKLARSSNGLGFRAHLHHHVRPRALPVVVLSSSMQFRAITGALVAAAVASGAFYAYNGNQSTAHTPSPVDHARSLSTAAATSEPTRKALVVGAGELYTGTITGSGPISKDTDESGRKVLEMLSPEQATAKLRKNEESWLVGRGQGVVRYDVVQSKFSPFFRLALPLRMLWADTSVLPATGQGLLLRRLRCQPVREAQSGQTLQDEEASR